MSKKRRAEMAEIWCPDCGAGEDKLVVLYDNEDGTFLYECSECGARFVEDE